MREQKPVIGCANCRRAVYVGDVDAAGLCCYCQPPAVETPMPTGPIVPAGLQKSETDA